MDPVKRRERIHSRGSIAKTESKFVDWFSPVSSTPPAQLGRVRAEKRTDTTQPGAAMIDLVYDGRILHWHGHGNFKATSGMTGLQEPRFQCIPDGGPIPEGEYKIATQIDPHPARDDGTHSCSLMPARSMQLIPRGSAAAGCEPYWSNWGWHRVRVEAAELHTRQRCATRRSGFYLHDSTKGYTHGCIEVEGSFFSTFVGFIRQRGSAVRNLRLKVQYIGLTTNGGTASP